MIRVYDYYFRVLVKVYRRHLLCFVLSKYFSAGNNLELNKFFLKYSLCNGYAKTAHTHL